VFLNEKGIFLKNWIHTELFKLVRIKGNP
jgi:hypothetical protein